jgi:glucose dehydrogenase
LLKTFFPEKIKIGTPIFSGLALNSLGILFVTGTDDNLAYAIDAKTGEEIWSHEMDAAGSVPPIIFNHNNKQYVNFLSTGGQFHNFKKNLLQFIPSQSLNKFKIR